VWDKDAEGRPKDPWQETIYLVMRAEGDPSQVYTFTSTSVGGRNAVRKLKKEFRDAYPDHKPEARPIIELGVDKYKHKNVSFGWIKFPTLKLVGWTDDQQGVSVISPPASVSSRRHLGT
jgi:hypothetical protein